MTYQFIKKFEQNYEKIYQDYLSIKNKVVPWPEPELYDKGWEVFGLFMSKDVSTLINRDLTFSTECAFTKNLISQNVPNHGTAGFSLLKANSVIKPHEGLKSNYFRMHLGLEVPEGDLGILTASHGLLRWEEGKAFYFDDTLLHEAWNKTNQDRVVLLMDFER
tara:strand:+ start:223 stop:711 length:489 start_codon:yes stop_codon:yes gene_type:complete